jgi:hypothetical protein
MAEYQFTVIDVEVIVANPSRGTFAPPNRDRFEHYDFARDGRLLNVVTKCARTIVITVVQE